MSLTVKNIRPFSPYFADFKRLYHAVFPDKARFPISLLVLMSLR